METHSFQHVQFSSLNSILESSLPVIQWSDLCKDACMHSSLLERPVYCYFSVSRWHACSAVSTPAAYVLCAAKNRSRSLLSRSSGHQTQRMTGHCTGLAPVPCDRCHQSQRSQVSCNQWMTLIHSHSLCTVVMISVIGIPYHHHTSSSDDTILLWWQSVNKILRKKNVFDLISYFPKNDNFKKAHHASY